MRSRGLAGQLLVLQPVEQALRREEAQAFQRLLRVLSHEINNSMTPIISAADTLRRVARREPLSDDWQDDLDSGLALIGQRGAALQRFLAGYAQLARLPAPHCAKVSLKAVATHVLGLFNTGAVVIVTIEDATIWADRDQLEQVLINLLRNAIEADTSGNAIMLGWSTEVGLAADPQVRIEIRDRGPGLPASGNPFVPFFTTKPNGSGIGLVLSRQIVEAQHGSLELLPCPEGVGAMAVVKLPLAALAQSAAIGTAM